MVYVLAKLKVESYANWKTFFVKDPLLAKKVDLEKLISSVTQKTRMKC